jgi:hypothetical protein
MTPTQSRKRVDLVGEVDPISNAEPKKLGNRALTNLDHQRKNACASMTRWKLLPERNPGEPSVQFFAVWGEPTINLSQISARMSQANLEKYRQQRYLQITDPRVRRPRKISRLSQHQIGRLNL